MAGEFALQFNTKAFSDPSLTYGTNPAFEMNASSFPTTNSDMSIRQFRLGFQDTKAESAPHQMQNIVSDNRVGRKLDFSI